RSRTEATADGAARLREADDARRARDQAVDRERRERARLEVPDEIADREVRGDPGDDRADDDLAMDVVPGRAGEARELQHAGGEDDRRREQKREARGVLVGEAAPQAADHGDA